MKTATTNTQAQQYYSTLEARKNALKLEIEFVERTQQEAVEFFGAEVTSEEVRPNGKKRGPKPRTTQARTNGKKVRKIARRSSEDIAKTQAAVFKFLKSHPGSKSGEICEAVGIEALELVVPLKKLLAAKQVKKKGERGSTTYFPKGASTN